MPTCFITVAQERKQLNKSDINYIRTVVAEGLDSKARKLDKTHLTIRVNESSIDYMLGDIEIEIFAQLYLRRLFSRDKRANYISKKVSNHLQCGCATWINLEFVGYSRSTPDGSDYYSDADNRFVRAFQRLRGISTRINH